MTIPFEPTRSYVYRAARYELIPRIAENARDFGDEPFLLRDISKRVLSETYTTEQLETRIKKANSDASEKMSNIFGFYIPYLAEELHVFEKLGGVRRFAVVNGMKPNDDAPLRIILLIDVVRRLHELEADVPRRRFAGRFEL